MQALELQDPYTVTSPYVQLVPYGVEIPNRVFIGGLSYDMTELELRDFFSQFGCVKDSKIVTDRMGVSKGYGFITFCTEEEAANVYTKGSLFYKEKKLNVSKAIRKQGGQYTKANQEYTNGQRMLYWHPRGYLMSHGEGGWMCEQAGHHSQPSKPCFSLMMSPSPTATSPPYLQQASVPPPGSTAAINGYLPGPAISQSYQGPAGEMYSVPYYQAQPSSTYSYTAAPEPQTSITTSCLPHSNTSPPLAGSTIFAANVGSSFALQPPPPPAHPSSLPIAADQELESGSSSSSLHSGAGKSDSADVEKEAGEEVASERGEGEGSSEKELSSLEEQTEALSLSDCGDKESGSADGSPKLHRPGTNGLAHRPLFSGVIQPRTRRSPRFPARHSAGPRTTLPPSPYHHHHNHHAHAHGMQYNNYQTQSHTGYPAPMPYVSPSPQTIYPPAQSISGLNFTPPISPILASL